MLFIVTSPHLTFLNIGCNLYTAWQTITIYQISNTKIDVKKSKAVQENYNINIEKNNQ